MVLNCIACIGWSTINTIVGKSCAPAEMRRTRQLTKPRDALLGASTLRAVSSTHKLPNAAGIIIIAVLTVVVALFGYKYVHAFERYASIPIVVIFFIMLGEAAPPFPIRLWW